MSKKYYPPKQASGDAGVNLAEKIVKRYRKSEK